jgi:hypothetical protein
MPIMKLSPTPPGKIVGIVIFKGRVIVATESGVFELVEDVFTDYFKPIRFIEVEENG